VRTIRKRVAPNSLTQWRAPRLAANRSEGLECTYEEMRRSSAVLEAIEDNLLAEQGGICAYTGHRIRMMPAYAAAGGPRTADFHIEHLTPQVHCAYGQGADYSNLVACWPRPNCGFEPAYGAKRKGSWPSPEEQALFVSPLRADCSARFKFNHLGEIRAAQDDDAAANRTIDRLGLNDSTLTDLRRQAIRGALNPPTRPIRLNEARKLLRGMERDSDDVNQGVFIQLQQFCFAIQPALEREIRKLEAIRNQV
jgi:uncharacterized protein (TIGR02646 family)